MTEEELQHQLVKQAKAELWRRRKVWPLLELYLDRDQLIDARAFFQGGDVERGRLPADDWCDDISRQRGKSWKWTVISVVWAHCHPGQQIKYLAQFGSSVRGIIAPTISLLIEDMPKEYRPKHDGPEAIEQDSVDHKWHFPHPGKAESCIHAAGANNKHYKALRGPRAHLLIQDECAFYDDFPEVQDALRPMLTTTGGASVYATTPPTTPAHPYEKTCESLKTQGRYVHRTIYGHPRLSEEQVTHHLTREATRMGMDLKQFRKTTYYRREYLCMHVLEESRAICPEWNACLDDDNPELGYASQEYIFDDPA